MATAWTCRQFQHRFFPAAEGPGDRLMVVLHGLGDSWRGYAWMPQALGLPWLSYLMVNAPDAYYGGYSWYDFQGQARTGVARSRELLLGLVDDLAAQGLDPDRLLLFGFSQGCLMAADAGLRARHRLAGICGVSGYLEFEEEYPAAFGPAARAQAFLITHGTDDPVIPFAPARRQWERIRELGINLEFRAYGKDHTILPEELEDLKAWIAGRLGPAGG